MRGRRRSDRPKIVIRLVLSLDPVEDQDILQAISKVPPRCRARWALRALRGGIGKVGIEEMGLVDDSTLDALGLEL